MQLYGFGVVAPIYAILHLLFAPLNAAILSEKILRHPRLIINSIWAGYVFITVLNMIPLRETNPVLDQRLMAVWQIFPLILSLVQFVFGLSTGRQPTEEAKRSSHHILETTYLFSLRFCTFTHLVTVLILAISTFYPSLYSTVPFLSANVASDLSALTFSSVFSPPNPFPPTGLGGPTPQMTSMVSAIHGLLNWDLYVGMTSLIVWSCTVMSRAKSPNNEGGLLRDSAAVLMLAAVGGPAGVLVGAMMYRDWLLLEDSGAMKKRVE